MSHHFPGIGTYVELVVRSNYLATTSNESGGTKMFSLFSLVPRPPPVFEIFLLSYIIA